MSPADVGRRLSVMESRPRSQRNDDMNERRQQVGVRSKYDYTLDDNRVIRYHAGATEAYVTFLQDGVITEKAGHVRSPQQHPDELAAVDEI